MPTPSWYAPDLWSDPQLVDEIRNKRSLIPSEPGLYLFTNHPDNVEAGFGIMYVGETENLRKRLPSYIKDPARMNLFSRKHGPPTVNTSLGHAGAALMLMKIQQRMRSSATGTSGIWVRWLVCAGHVQREKDLIQHLRPAMNTEHNDR